MASENNCILCDNKRVDFLYHQKEHLRDFYQCSNCELIFVDRDQLLENSEEKSRYSTHQNHIRSEGYEKFLRRIINPIVKRVSQNAIGLDYGEGPYPMLREILKDEGLVNVQGYDPYFNNSRWFDSEFDFITCSEVIEHINNLKKDLDKIVSALKSDGYLAISTGITYPNIHFETWHYIKDPTHINFFSEQTFDWIASNYKFEAVESSNDFTLLKKK